MEAHFFGNSGEISLSNGHPILSDCSDSSFPVSFLISFHYYYFPDYIHERPIPPPSSVDLSPSLLASAPASAPVSAPVSDPASDASPPLPEIDVKLVPEKIAAKKKNSPSKGKGSVPEVKPVSPALEKPTGGEPSASVSPGSTGKNKLFATAKTSKEKKETRWIVKEKKKEDAPTAPSEPTEKKNLPSAIPTKEIVPEAKAVPSISPPAVVESETENKLADGPSKETPIKPQEEDHGAKEIQEPVAVPEEKQSTPPERPAEPITESVEASKPLPEPVHEEVKVPVAENTLKQPLSVTSKAEESGDSESEKAETEDENSVEMDSGNASDQKLGEEHDESEEEEENETESDSQDEIEYFNEREIDFNENNSSGNTSEYENNNEEESHLKFEKITPKPSNKRAKGTGKSKVEKNKTPAPPSEAHETTVLPVPIVDSPLPVLSLFFLNFATISSIHSWTVLSPSPNFNFISFPQ